MDRRSFLVSAMAVASLHGAAAAQSRTLKIGWLTAQQEASLTPYLAALKKGFGELGYVEGQNLIIDYRFGNDRLDRVPELATELVKSGVELIVAQGAAVSEIAKLTLPVPIVYIFSGDPVAAGLADSLSRPRGNMTGVTLMAAELNSKRLEILRDIVPGLRRVAIIANPEHHGVNLERANSEQTGQRLGIEIRYYPTPSPTALDAALAAIKADPALKNIPVVVLTTSQDETDIMESYRQFASSYIVKPVSMDKFIKVVSSFKQYWLSVVKLPGQEAA